MDKYTLAEWRRLRNISQSDLAKKQEYHQLL